mgnify:CR=1 FL=1
MKINKWDALWVHARIDGVDDAALAVQDGNIAWVGDYNELPGEPDELAKCVHNVSGCCITPGFIDCHTHLVYAGNRAHEFEKRLNGATYEEIAREGGGIQSTVTATRAASEEELFEQSLPRAMALQSSGVTTLEIKSGYGLDWQTESKMLRVAKRIGEALPLTVKRTFLGAHTIPLEYRGKAQDYIDLVCQEMIPKVAEEKLADAVDVFCESIAFNVAQTEQVFIAAKKYNLAVKCHGEQLTCSDSAVLAATHQALSVDHLEHASPAGIRAMAKAGLTAVILPGAYYFLRETKQPPITLIRELGLPMALASDCNPGTSPIMSLLTIMNMACTLFRLTPVEVLQGVTINAAKALGMSVTHGSLNVGKVADFAVWRVTTPAELCYYLGNQPLVSLYKTGVEIKHEQLFTGN